jgi:hypothetical protein
VENRECRAVNGSIEIGVIEDDVCALASELQLDPLEVAGRRFDDTPSDGGGPRKRNLLHPRMTRQVGTGGLAESRNNVDHSGREANFRNQLGQAE